MALINEQTGNHNINDNLIPQYKWGEDVEIDVDVIKANLADIKKNIVPCKPKIIGITKYYGRSSIVNGYNAGLRDFGESRVFEAVDKIESLPDEVRQNSKFHFIGHLQTNKVNKVIGVFDYIHSVDSLKLATAISNCSKDKNLVTKILLQVNNAGEVQKFGYSKEALIRDMAEIIKLPNIKVIGLMNIAPLSTDETMLRQLFHDVTEFKSALEKKFNILLPELSMGMSNDYIIAVEEGATMIRVGKKLFTK